VRSGGLSRPYPADQCSSLQGGIDSGRKKLGADPALAQARQMVADEPRTQAAMSGSMPGDASIARRSVENGLWCGSKWPAKTISEQQP
jgi:hypothetical protein